LTLQGAAFTFSSLSGQRRAGRVQEYFDLATCLRTELQKIVGFIAVERFESLTSEGKYLSLSVWRDEEAVRAWREVAEHKAAQDKGKSEIFVPGWLKSLA